MNDLAADYAHLKGLDGWLILVGLGLLMTPIVMMITLVPLYSPFLQEGVWNELTNPASEFYIPLFGPVLIAETVINFLLLTAWIYLIILFFSKHYTFPKLYIFLAVFQLIYLPLNAWFVSLVFSIEPMFDEATVRDFFVSLLQCCIWVPYMLFSKRVNVTFVEGKNSPVDR